MEIKEVEKLRSQVLATIDLYRGLILDSVEMEFGDTPQWPVIRSRLLKMLGNRGLEGKILQSIDGNGTGGNHGPEQF